MLKLKLKKSLKKNIYYIIVIDKNRMPKSYFIECLGFYIINKDIYGNKYLFLNVERLKYWLSRGLVIDFKIYFLISKLSYSYNYVKFIK